MSKANMTSTPIYKAAAKENLYTKDCIRTFTGIYMNVFQPTIEMICIEDIAHALSFQCRFGGHLPEFYSVAQHSVMCMQGVNDEHRLAALLHDASEAYLMDIPKPIKSNIPDYAMIENKLMNLIAKKFGFEYPLHSTIKEVDEILLNMEWEVKMLNLNTWPKWKTWDSNESKKQFLQKYNELTSATEPT